jgi:hypothetical protein
MIYKTLLRFCFPYPTVGRRDKTRWYYEMFSAFFRTWEVAISVTTCGTASAFSGCDTKPHFQPSLKAWTYTFSNSGISSSKILLLYLNKDTEKYSSRVSREDVAHLHIHVQYLRSFSLGTQTKISKI